MSGGILSANARIAWFYHEDRDNFKLRFWDVANEKEIRSIEFGTRFTKPKFLNATQLGPNGRCFIYMENCQNFYSMEENLNHRVLLWDLKDESQQTILSNYDHNVAPIFAVFNPDGDKVAISTASIPVPEDELDRSMPTSGAVQVWDLSRGNWLSEPMRIEGALIEEIAWSPDGRYLITTAQAPFGGQASYETYVWDSTTAQRISPPFKHNSSIDSVDFAPNGKWVATAGRDGTARVWEVDTGRSITPPLQHEEGLTA